MVDENKQLKGRKGGEKKAYTPVEVANNLLSKSYAKVLIAVAEGELAGTPTARDIYLNGTPLESSSGLQNFGGVKWEWRSGRTDQAYIAGMPEVSNEFPIDFDLTETVAYTRLLTNSELDAVRVTMKWPSLLEQKDNGDIVGYNIVYAIDVSTNGAAYVEVGRWDTNTGKTTVEYDRTHRVDLPREGTSWTLRVRRITPKQTNIKIQDVMTVKSVAEVIDAKFRYPNTALLYVEFDAELFGGTSIPAISVRTKGRYIQVPTNYDPETRAYSGIWNGTFKWSWSDNPAWVFYDLVTNERFGLGSRITPEMVNKWQLYQIAQYCDVMVPDGEGGIEPRHTCNMYIQSRREAWQVLRDIVAIFNGMLHWNGTQMVATADMPVDITAIRTYSRSNVVDGKFTYGTPSEKTVYTTAMVSYDDPENHYKTAVEAVNDVGLVRRWKTWSQAELTAIGCISRGEAQRKGKYAMLTNSLNRIVNFKLGMEGYLPSPGDVIGIADQVLAGAQLSGRIHSATTNSVTLDRDTTAVAGDILYINKADGVTGEGRTVLSVTGRVITVTSVFSAAPQADLTWYVEKTTLKSQLFRVSKVSWEDEAAEYTVTATLYEDSKYAAIDNGARLESRPITNIPAGGQAAPTGLTVTSFTYLEQTMAITNLSVKWTPAAGAMNYEAQWRKDGGDWLNIGLTAATGFDVRGIYSGAYQARVRAINALGTKSVWVESTSTQIAGKSGTPPALTTLTVDPIVFGMRINWTFPNGAEDTARTEIMYSPTPSFTAATKLGDFAYPQHTHEMSGLKAGVQFYFWGRLVDRSGNVGPWTPLESANGVLGQSSTDVDKYEEYFLGQIKDSALGQQLAERIDLIDGPPTMLGSVNARVDEVKGQVDQINSDLSDRIDETNQTLTDVNNNLQTQINAIEDLADSMPYDTTKTYTTGQAVLGTDSKLYQAKQAVPINTAPPNATYWTDIGQAVVTADGLAARVTTVETTVTSQGGQIAANASSINGLTTTVNGKADTSALNSLTTRVTTAEGTITSQGQAITGLQSSVSGKADSSAVTALTTRVTTAENTITSQGNSITSVQATLGGIGGLGANLLPAEYSVFNSVAPVASTNAGYTVTTEADTNTFSGYDLKVTTNNTTVTSLYLTPAGGSSIVYIHGNMGFKKSKYIVSYRAKASVAGHIISPYIKSLSSDNTFVSTNVVNQNQALTTAWVKYSAVIDATSVSHVGDKMVLAFSVNVSATSGRVVYIDQIMIEEQVGTSVVPSAFTVGNSNGQSLTNASATTALTARVTTAEGTITAQGTSITNLQATVAGKADSSAVSALDARVTTAEGTITSQGSSITTINANIDNIGASGSNLLKDTYSWLTSTTLPAMSSGSGVSGVAVAVAGSSSGFGYKITHTASSVSFAMLASPNNATGWNVNVEPGTYLVSMYVQASVDGTMRVSLYDGTQRYSPTLAYTTTRTRLTFPITVAGSTRTGVTLYTNMSALATVDITIDSVMVEKRLGTSNIASPFVAGSSADSTAASASATSALTARVTTAEGTITSQGSSITSINTSIGNDDTDNWVRNPLFNASGNLNTITGTVATLVYLDSTDASIPTPVPSNRVGLLTRLTTGTLQLVAFALKTAPNRMSIVAGETLAMSIKMCDTNSVANVSRFVVTFYNAAGTNLGNNRLLNYDYTVGGWQNLSGSIVAPATTVSASISIFSETSAPVGGKLFFAEPVVNKIDGATAVNAKATTDLSARVTTAEGTITAQAGSITSIQATLGGLGLDPAPSSSWQFDTSVEGWTAAGATLSQSAGQLTITSTGNDPTLISPATAINGSLYPKVKVKITRVAGSAWDGRVFYGTAGHGFTASYYKIIPNPNLTAGQSVVLDLDMAALTAGGNDWITSTITQFRLDFGSATSDVFSIDWIGVGRDGPSASSSALSQLNTIVTQQGDTITAQATKLDGIFVQVNPVQAGDTVGYAGSDQAYVGVWSEQSARIEDGVSTGQRVDALQATSSANTAAISNESLVRADADSALATQQSTTQTTVNGLTTTVQQTSSSLSTLDGKTQAMWSVKLQVNAQGQYVTAGIGLGLENTAGGLQSTFLVNANTFAVVNGVDATLTNPFTVTGGQVFIKDAIIANGAITNAKIGQVIQSDNYVFNTSGWAINKTGGFEMNGTSGGGRMQLTGSALKFYHSNGVLGIDLSL